jgi:hypothetical protein
MRMVGILLIVGCWLGAAPLQVAAQSVNAALAIPADTGLTRTFGHLSHTQLLRIHLRGGAAVEGRLVRTIGDTALVRTGRDTVRVPMEAVDSLSIRTSQWKAGAIVGALTVIPLLHWLHGLCEDAENRDCSYHGKDIAVGAVVATPGLVIGSLVGGSVTRWRRKYPVSKPA